MPTLGDDICEFAEEIKDMNVEVNYKARHLPGNQVIDTSGYVKSSTRNNTNKLIKHRPGAQSLCVDGMQKLLLATPIPAPSRLHSRRKSPITTSKILPTLRLKKDKYMSSQLFQSMSSQNNNPNIWGNAIEPKSPIKKLYSAKLTVETSPHH